jgi:CheY-like chemotaxis protein
MPGIDGIMLAQEIRAEEFAYEYHLLLLSSLWEADLGEEEARLFDAILNKPIKKSTLISHMLGCTGVAAQPEAQPSTDERSRRLEGRHLLLVEDNLVNQRVAVALLEREGARVSTALDGLQALDSWRENDYDLILMDLQMPEMDGITATIAIRSDSSRRGKVPILAMTACAMQEEQRECLEAGMDGHVAKPFKIDDLVRAILDCVARVSEAGSRAMPLVGGQEAEMITVRNLERSPRSGRGFREH